MEFNIPSKFKIGGDDYKVNIVEHCGVNDNFGRWWCTSDTIEIANQSGGYKVSDSRKRQTFFRELTHAILFQMGKYDLNEDDSFVNSFSAFLSEAINTME